MKKILLLLPLIVTSCNSNSVAFSYSEINSKYHSYMTNSVLVYSYNNIPYAENDNSYEALYFTPYLANNPNGTSVIVFPGGAYHMVAGDKVTDTQYEGADIAPFYNEKGISVFVAHYRTQSDNSSFNYKYALSDGFRIVRYIRSHAKEYKIDPSKIGVMGYSAGGNLAMELTMHPELEVDDVNYKKDNIDKVSNDLAFGILCYPVVSFDDEYTHYYTKKFFTNDDEEIANYYTGENFPSSFNKPLFIWGSDNDDLIRGCRYVSSLLIEEGKDCEFISYPDGWHGVGTAQSLEYCSHWVNDSLSFLAERGF